MIPMSLFLMAALSAGAPAAVRAVQAAPASNVEWEAGGVHVQGEPFPVKLVLRGGDAGQTLEVWKLEAGAFEADGQPLAKRGEGTLALAPGAVITAELDLGSYLKGGKVQLSYAGSEQKVEVDVVKAAPHDQLKFLDMAPEDLAKYRALLVTNRGPILVELWPDVAPNHVRNFLDLVDTGFFQGILFHRVSPSFMIQGGDPNTRDRPKDRGTWGSGNGPRRVPQEVSDRKHVPGVLSAARSADPNSASSQFFVMTAANTGLDGKYSAFGKVLKGMEAVQAIASEEGEVLPDGSTFRPFVAQRIERTYVILPD